MLVFVNMMLSRKMHFRWWEVNSTAPNPLAGFEGPLSGWGKEAKMALKGRGKNFR